MAKTFNFNGEILWSDSITLNSLGNVALEAVDAFERNYYLIIKTALGGSTILEFGPVYPGDETIPDDYTIKYTTCDYSDNAMIKRINSFLGPKKGIGNKKVSIVKVSEIRGDLALTYGIDPFKYLMSQYQEE